MLCSDLRCQKTFRLNVFSHNILCHRILFNNVGVVNALHTRNNCHARDLNEVILNRVAKFGDL